MVAFIDEQHERTRRAKWDERFIAMARHASEWSKDRSTKVGAVIVGPSLNVLSTGYNGFPRGVDDAVEARHQRPVKYAWTEHAERNAIYNAARHGVKLEGATLYSTWYPCCDCARAAVQSGIVTLVTPAPDFDHERWGEQFKIVREMLTEVGLEVRYL